MTSLVRRVEPTLLMVPLPTRYCREILFFPPDCYKIGGYKSAAISQDLRRVRVVTSLPREVLCPNRSHVSTTDKPHVSFRISLA